MISHPRFRGADGRQILIGKPFVAAGVHHRPGAALGFGLFAPDGPKTQSQTTRPGWTNSNREDFRLETDVITRKQTMEAKSNRENNACT
jgi:hypothetical protein